MDSNLINFIKKCKIFASLEAEDDVYQALLSEFEEQHVEEGEYLFRQTEMPNYFYLVVNGRFSASFPTETGKAKIVGYIQPGESIGELGAISNEPRSLDIKAVEKSLVLRLPCSIFKKLCRQYPSLLFETVSPLVNRSREVIKALSASEKKKHVGIIPANKDFNTVQFEVLLQETLKHYKKVILLSETEINSDNARTTVNVDKIMADAEAENHVILYLLKSHETPLSKACWSKLSKVYVLGNGDDKPNLSQFVREKLHNLRHLLQIRRELVLFYPNQLNPRFTPAWLEEGSFFLHHHIKAHEKSDYQRLLRFMRGKAVGIVLSGGGARGWAHIGAMNAMIEANIPIDAIGGSSIGAVVGSLYARNKDMVKINEELGQLLERTRNVVSLKNICWPAISVFDCKDYTLETQRLFQETQIENLALPFFCVTCNLGTYREAVHRSGLLWERIRGSSSVPGLVPPIVINGEMHIDGGVVNNLPVNIMRDMLGTESKIIAVELVSRITDNKRYNFPPTLTFKEAFLSKLHLGYRDYKFPAFLDTFVKSLLVGSSAKQEENAATADVLITPHTGKYSMLRATEAQREELIRLGHKSASHQLQDWDYKK